MVQWEARTATGRRLIAAGEKNQAKIDRNEKLLTINKKQSTIAVTFSLMASHSTPLRTLREQIAGHIRADILAGSLPKGAPLREQSLAKRFGVSRGPIRDVLLQLTQEGLLVSEPNCGVRVSSPPSEWMQPLIVKLRREIETFSLKKSIKNLSVDDISRLEEIVNELGLACSRRDMAAIAEQDIAFHRCLLEFAGDDDLVAIWVPIVTRMIMHYSRHEDMEQSHAEHVAIFEAVRERDSRAAVKALEKNIQ